MTLTTRAEATYAPSAVPTVLPVSAALVPFPRYNPTVVNDLAATLISRLAALALLVVLLPLLLVLAAAVVLTSRGPAVFRQERIGRSGRTFVIYKFRTMQVGADRRLAELLASHGLDEVTPFFKVRADPRVTRLGSWLRTSSLDELPQLVNVVRGDMNLVGPRPQTPAEVATYAERSHGRHTVRPGMTGLWQVSGRSQLGAQESLDLDLAYVAERSFWLDVKILTRTPVAVLAKRGAC